MTTILIADDDAAMLMMVKELLLQENYDVLTAQSGEQVLDIIELEHPDLFILDLTLQNMDGITLCRHLRTIPELADTPIIFLTGHHSAYSVAEALEVGGDDYIRKPFAVRELLARIRAHLRRIVTISTTSQATLRFNPDTYQVFVDNREIPLTRIEFDLLAFMASEPQKWHPTQDLLGGVWNYPDGVGDTALVRNHIRNLRRKLEINPDHPAIIQSRHGRGYSICAHVEFDNRHPASSASSS